MKTLKAKERLAVATLLPAYEEAIKQNIGRVFAEPTVLSESAPESIRKLSTDIDMEGNRLDVWAQQFFSIGFQYGLFMRWWTIPEWILSP